MEVEKVLERRIASVFTQEFASAGGVRNVAEILNRVDRSTEKAIMEKLEESNPDLADEGRMHLSHVVEAADRLANELNYSVSEGRELTGSSESSLEGLKLSGAAPNILGEFEVDFEVLKAFI